MCQNYQGKDKVGNADVALKCARTSGIDWETSDVGQCAGLDGTGTGEEGIELLKQSVEVTESLGIVYDDSLGTVRLCSNGTTGTVARFSSTGSKSACATVSGGIARFVHGLECMSGNAVTSPL